MKNLIITILLGVFTGFFAQAQDVTKPTKCIDPQSQEEQNACAALEYEKAENQLTRLYKQVNSLIESDAKKPLATAQKNFNIMLENHCQVYKSYYNNSPKEPLVISNCKITLTNNRIIELQSVLDEIKKKSEADEKAGKK